MTREQLLQQVDEGLLTEESATTIYLAHLDAIATRSGLPAARIEEARAIIQPLVRSNKRHAVILKDLRHRILQENIDVY